MRLGILSDTHDRSEMMRLAVDALRARGSALPVIFVTSDEDEATRAFAMASGATAYFTKPLANAELIKILAEILGPGRGS